MKIKTSFPIAAVSGRMGDSDLVIVKRGDKCYARRYAAPKNPQSKDQVAVRRFLSNATKTWGSLTPIQREGWEKYAKEFSEAIVGEILSAYNMFSKVQYYRQALGQPLLLDPPTLPPPLPPHGIKLRPAGAPDEFRFQLEHGIVERAHYVVGFEITPAMPSPGRKPRNIEFRMIRHVGPESFFALLAPTGTYIISGARFAVDHAQRFGVRARIVSFEGVPSRPVAGDFLKIIQWGLKPHREEQDEPDLFSVLSTDATELLTDAYPETKAKGLKKK
ncbi:MAG: hypothetical protein ACPL7D_07140 [Candidatus Sumerlaeaceae bacterium]|jgi:hypothetical protein